MRFFSDNDGLPQNSAEALALDKNGCVWAGTQNGLARYNGRRWVAVPLPDVASEPWVLCLLSSRDGDLWVGVSEGGVYCLRAGRWLSFTGEAGAPSKGVSKIIETADGSIMTAGYDGLCRWKNEKWSRLDMDRRSPLQNIIEVCDSEGVSTLWAGTSTGLGQYKNHQWRWFSTEDGLPSNRVKSLLEHRTADGKSMLWIGTNHGLARWNGTRIEKVNLDKGPLEVNHITESISPQGEHSIWLGTESGLVRYFQGRWKYYDYTMGMPSNSIRSLLVQSPPGGRTLLWIGTFSGVLRIAEGGWTQFKPSGFLADSPVFSILESQSNKEFLLGTYGSGLFRMRTDRDGEFPKKVDLEETHILSLLETGEGNSPRSQWIGTKNNGLLRMNGGKITRFGLKEGLPNPQVMTIRELDNERGEKELWVGTPQGPAFLKAGRFHLPAPLPGVTWGSVISIVDGIDHDGKKVRWMALRGSGLLEIKEGAGRVFKQRDGLVDDNLLCMTKHIDSAGVSWLWLGSTGGCCRTRLDRPGRIWENIDGLSGRTVYSLLEGVKGRIYACTNLGVIRVEQQPEDGGKTLRFHYKSYTTGDGLPSNGCTQGSGLRDSRGRIWTGTLLGAAMLDPANDPVDTLKKWLSFEEVKTGNTVLKPNASVRLDWRHPNLHVHYSLLSYFREEDTRFCTQMVGLEKKPSPWSPLAEREFPHLPGGSYHLKVWAKDGNGNPSGPIYLKVIVPRPPYFSPWAWVIYTVLASVVIFRLYHTWRRSIQHQQKGLETRLEISLAANREAQGAVEKLTVQSSEYKKHSSLFHSLLKHGLRQPLGELSGMAKNLAAHAVSPKEVALAESLHGMSENLLGTMNEIMDCLDSTLASREMVVFDPVAEMEACLAAFSEPAHRKGLELVGHFEAGLPQSLQGDLVSLRQVVVHLLSYAIQFTREGEVRLRLGVYRDAPGMMAADLDSIRLVDGRFIPESATAAPMSQRYCQLRLEVSDTGIGLTPECLRTFLTMNTTEATLIQDFEEGGVGLYLCRRLVDRLGGSFQAESEVSSGSSFLCRIPLAIAPVGDGRSAPDFLGSRVAVFDTNLSALESLATTLRQWNIFPVLFDHPEQVAEPGALKNCKAVLMGQGGRKGDPSYLVELIKPCDLPVMLLVGTPAIDACEKLKAQGRALYVLKPARRARLLQVLKRLLDITEREESPIESIALDEQAWEGLRYLELVSGPGAISEILDSFLKDAPNRLDRMEIALAEDNRRLLSRLARDFKSNIESLGASSIGSLGEEIEYGAESLAREVLQDLIERCRQSLPAAMASVKARAKTVIEQCFLERSKGGHL